MDKDYQPYGPEWENEMMKWSKANLVKYLKEKLQSQAASPENQWKVIKIEDLPDNVPVLAVKEMQSKSFAEFHLTEFVLFPISGKFPKATTI